MKVYRLPCMPTLRGLERVLAGNTLLICAVLTAVVGCSTKSSTEPAAAATASALTSETNRGPVSMELRFSPESPSLSDEIELAIVVRRDEDYSLIPPQVTDLFEDFLVNDFDSGLPRREDGKIVVRHVYTLEPLTPGEVTLEGIPYRFKADKDTEPVVVETEPLTVQIQTMLDDTRPLLTELGEPQSPLLLPPNPYRHAYWIAGGVALLGALVGAIVWWRRKTAVPPPQLTAAQIARRDLDALEASGVSETDHKTFFVKLTGIVRRFIEGTTGIRAPEQTTDEFLRVIEQRDVFSRSDQQKFGYFLQAADLVKYAAQEPGPDEIGASLRTAKAFIAEPTIDETQAAPASPAREVVS